MRAEWSGRRTASSSAPLRRNTTKGVTAALFPCSPELQPYLQDVWDAIPEGTQAEYVITRDRDTNANLRTQLCRIIKRAGLKSWPKLFQNPRSTRQTELSNRFPAHVVCARLGNTEGVAKDHYLQVTDSHFAQAVQDAPTGSAEAAQNAAQQPATSTCGEAQAVAAPLDESAKRTRRSGMLRRAANRVMRGWPRWDSNPHAFWATDFESVASANSATRPW